MFQRSSRVGSERVSVCLGLSRHQRMNGFEVRGREGLGIGGSFGRSTGLGRSRMGGFKKAVVEGNASRLICESRRGAAGGHSLVIPLGRAGVAGREICLVAEDETGSTGSSASIQMIVGCVDDVVDYTKGSKVSRLVLRKRAAGRMGMETGWEDGR